MPLIRICQGLFDPCTNQALRLVLAGLLLHPRRGGQGFQEAHLIFDNADFCYV